MVEAQREIFRRFEDSAGRTVYQGVGSGGDRTLEIDRLCEDAAFAELERAAAEAGAIAVVSEERGEVRLGGDGPPSAWVVIDPIDGSLNARRMIPAHSFCLAVAGGTSMADVDFGFVHDFGCDEEFAAWRGGGAQLDGRPLKLAEARLEATPTLEVVGLESADPAIAAEPIAALAGHVHRLRAVGSIAISTCQVAAGRFDGMFSLRPCRSVDAAAAQLIVREAGGQIEFGDGGLAAIGLGLDARFPIRAAATAAGLETLRAAQDLSSGFN